MVSKFQPRPMPEAATPESRATRPAPDARLDAEERVFGLALGDSAAAWPLTSFGAGAEALEIRVGSRPAVILWDGRTRTAAAYTPEVEGGSAEPVKLAVDAGDPDAPWIDRRTGSRWSIAGRAVSGPLKGRTLRWLPGVMVKWYAWSAEYPGTALDGKAR
jgi:hypothetical protein